MKRNLLLVIILIVIFSISYLTEEYYPKLQQQRLDRTNFIIDFKKFKQLQKISFPNFVILTEKHKNKKYLRYTSNFLSKFRIVKKITQKEQTKFNFNKKFNNIKNKFSLVFLDNKVTIFIGEKISTSQNFYIKVILNNSKVYFAVASFEVEIKTITTKRKYESSSYPYKQMLLMLNAKDIISLAKMLK